MMLDRHPFRTSRRARGVHHVGEVALVRPGRQRPGSVQLDPRPVAIEEHRPRRGPGNAADQALLGEQEEGSAVRQDVRLPLLRIGGVHGNVGAARLEHGVHGDHHLGRPLGADRDPHLGTDPLLDQEAGQPVGSRLQLAAGDAVLPGDERDGIGRRRRAQLERLVQQAHFARDLSGPTPGGNAAPGQLGGRNLIRQRRPPLRPHR